MNEILLNPICKKGWEIRLQHHNFVSNLYNICKRLTKYHIFVRQVQEEHSWDFFLEIRKILMLKIIFRGGSVLKKIQIFFSSMTNPVFLLEYELYLFSVSSSS